MLIMSPEGLFCPAGGFHIDPHGAVENAVITHAHSDHARRGSRQYFCAESGVSLLRSRLGKSVSIRGIAFRESFALGETRISLHPAGHILGSAQVRIECRDQVWVASGDYKREADPTCEPFEVVPCNVFVTEATFGTPSFSWKKDADLGSEISGWWLDNSREGINSLIYAYSLGKAQRILGVLRPHASRAIYCHPAVTELTDCYRAHGIPLAPTVCLSTLSKEHRLRGELILAPPSFLKTEQAAVLGSDYRTAFASGWTARSTRGFDRGFVMSDHADWPDLLRTIQETRARRVYVLHRGKGALVRHLRSIGIEAFPASDLKPVPPACPEQLSLF
jgi:putative mRNA 3-end processing factor